MPTALIWGGLKIVLDCAGRYGQQFEKIRSHLETLQDHLWDLANCDMLYGSSPYSADVVRRLISRSYITILKFWCRCAKIIEHPIRYVAVTDHKLLAILGDLKKDAEELSKICERAEALLN
ncbi:hypothetical protein BDZ45DRAFT_4941 [Acephala macrosclerotiorum]|nr:hypothetical protein BDZ45DRAFT_4941 [Acephala macrosclerotiorum]